MFAREKGIRGRLVDGELVDGWVTGYQSVTSLPITCLPLLLLSQSHYLTIKFSN